MEVRCLYTQGRRGRRHPARLPKVHLRRWVTGQNARGAKQEALRSVDCIAFMSNVVQRVARLTCDM